MNYNTDDSSFENFKVPIKIDYWPGRPKYVKDIPVPYKRKICFQLISKLVDFVGDNFASLNEIGLNNVVIGLSGGLDSVCTLSLCKRALKYENVLAVIVDLGLESHTKQRHFSEQIAVELGISYKVVDASRLFRASIENVKAEGPFSHINIITRCIQNTVFQIADSMSGAVVSTVDRSEELLCRHMEYFYGHFAPLADLFKTEVMELATVLGVPEAVLKEEPGCQDAWLDKEVLGAGYDVIDPILFLLTERGWTADRIATEYSIDPEWVCRIEKRVILQKQRMMTNIFKIE